MVVENAEVVAVVAELIKVNNRPSAASISRTNLIRLQNIRSAAISSDLRSDVLDLFRPQL